jgi:hypothetical protein
MTIKIQMRAEISSICGTASVSALRREIIDYIREYENRSEAIRRFRGRQTMDAENTYEFFRSMERIRTDTHIVQYMLTFLEEIPYRAQIEQDIANPFEQFKSFVRFRINLLLEPDVRQAILRHQNGNKRVPLRIKNLHKFLTRRIEEANEPTPDSYKILFLVLLRLSNFWFSIHHHTVRCYRKIDIFVYRLSAFLLKKTLTENEAFEPRAGSSSRISLNPVGH